MDNFFIHSPEFYFSCGKVGYPQGTGVLLILITIITIIIFFIIILIGIFRIRKIRLV